MLTPLALARSPGSALQGQAKHAGIAFGMIGKPTMPA
jgi:hypothetical protein